MRMACAYHAPQTGRSDSPPNFEISANNRDQYITRGNPPQRIEENNGRKNTSANQAAETAEQAAAAAKLKRKKRRRRDFRNLLIRVVLLAVVLYVLCFHIVGLTTMPNGDMYPRIDAGDLVLFYRLDKDVRAQDVIIFEKDIRSIQEYDPKSADKAEPGDRAPATRVQETSLMGRVNRFVYDAEHFLGLRGAEGKQVFICRVVAAQGDTVEITEDGALIVNGNNMIESNIFSPTTPYVGFTEYPITLKPGECFVLADLRNGGADSRFFGPVSVDEILGKVIMTNRRNNI